MDRDSRPPGGPGEERNPGQRVAQARSVGAGLAQRCGEKAHGIVRFGCSDAGLGAEAQVIAPVKACPNCPAFRQRGNHPAGILVATGGAARPAFADAIAFGRFAAQVNTLGGQKIAHARGDAVGCGGVSPNDHGLRGGEFIPSRCFRKFPGFNHDLSGRDGIHPARCFAKFLATQGAIAVVLTQQYHALQLPALVDVAREGARACAVSVGPKLKIQGKLISVVVLSVESVNTCTPILLPTCSARCAEHPSAEVISDTA